MDENPTTERTEEERPTPPPWDLWGSDYAAIRATGALRNWEGRVWRWHGHGWDLVR